MRTLIVDDEPGIRSMAGKILSRSGAVCAMAGTAEEAIERLGRERFDVMLLDIRLPGIDGLTLARRVQQTHPDLALVMITGRADVDSVISAMQAGAVDYVTKPFGADALLRAYGRAEDRRRLSLAAHRAEGLQEAIAERTLEIRLLLSQPGESAQALVASYLAALRLRSAAAAGHAERVAALSRTLGEARGLSAADLDLVERAAVLHDIGKFTLPDALLARAEPLSDDEVAVVRRHPEFGHQILRGIPALSACAGAIISQLEHYDGSGTPLGIRGEQIPVAARLIAVANAFDVMTHPRPYAAQQSPLEALQEIEACAGSQFEPAAVAALLAHFGVEPRVDDWDALAE